MNGRSDESTAAQLRRIEQSVNRIVAVCSEVPAAAAAFGTMACQMRLLALNGVVQASKVPGLGGRALAVLGEFLSELPGQISPEVSQLEESCRVLATAMAQCAYLMRRYHRLLAGLLATMAHLDPDRASSRDSFNALRVEAVDHILHPGLLMRAGAHQQENLLHLHRCCVLIATRLVEQLKQAAQLMRATEGPVECITAIRAMAQYLAFCLKSEAAHLPSGGDQFGHLAETIRHSLIELDEKIVRMRSALAGGLARLQQIMRGTVHEEPQVV